MSCAPMWINEQLFSLCVNLWLDSELRRDKAITPTLRAFASLYGSAVRAHKDKLQLINLELTVNENRWTYRLL